MRMSYVAMRGGVGPWNAPLSLPSPPPAAHWVPISPHGSPLYSTLPHLQTQEAREPAFRAGSWQATAVERNGATYPQPRDSARRRHPRLGFVKCSVTTVLLARYGRGIAPAHIRT